MRVNYLTVAAVSFSVVGGLSDGGRFADATPPAVPVMASMLGRPEYPSLGAVAPKPAARAVVAPPPARPGEWLPFSLCNASMAAAPRAAIKLAAVPPPIAVTALHDLVAPGVVALVASKPKAAPQVATGVLTTASGLILTSRRAIANALESGGKLAAVHAGPRGHFGARELAAAVPARVLFFCSFLFLPLFLALPPHPSS